MTTDLFYEGSEGDAEPAPRARGGLAAAAAPSSVEMEAATLFTLGGRLGVATACLLAVSDTVPGNGARRRIADRGC